MKQKSVDNASMITIAVNTKEYFEKFKNKSIYKKTKSMRKHEPGMAFKSSTRRIMSIREYDDSNVKLPKKLI